jgi:hypothetical protein
LTGPTLQKIFERRSIFKILAIGGRVLGDEVDFFDAAPGHGCDLGDNRAEWSASERASNARDCAVSASVGTAFRDFDIGGVKG